MHNKKKVTPLQKQLHVQLIGFSSSESSTIWYFSCLLTLAALCLLASSVYRESPNSCFAAPSPFRALSTPLPLVPPANGDGGIGDGKRGVLQLSDKGDDDNFNGDGVVGVVLENGDATGDGFVGVLLDAGDPGNGDGVLGVSGDDIVNLGFL